MDLKDRSPTAERYYLNARQALLSQTRADAAALTAHNGMIHLADLAPPQAHAQPRSTSAHSSRQPPHGSPEGRRDGVKPTALQESLLHSPGVHQHAAHGGPTGQHYFCAGCAELRTEVDQLRDIVSSLEVTVGKLAFAIRENNAKASRSQSPTRGPGFAPAFPSDMGMNAHPQPQHYQPTQRQHHDGGYDSANTVFAGSPLPRSAVSTAATPAVGDFHSYSDAFETELMRSGELRSRAQLRHNSPGQFNATSPILRDQQASLAIKAELRIFEKRMVTSMTKLANRLAHAEADAANAIETSQAMHSDLATSISDLRVDKVSKSELKPLVLPIVDTARDITGERVANLYRLFGWSEARVQQAVSTNDIDRSTDTIFASPSMGRLVDSLVKNAADISALRDEVHHLHHVRMNDGPTLGAKQRLLGLDINDEMELKGVRVTQVFSGGPGHLAGFKVGDVITMVNHVHVTSRNDFLKVMSGVMPNTVVRIHRYRGRSGAHIPEELEVIASGDSARSVGAAI